MKRELGKYYWVTSGNDPVPEIARFGRNCGKDVFWLTGHNDYIPVEWVKVLSDSLCYGGPWWKSRWVSITVSIVCALITGTAAFIEITCRGSVP